MSHTPRNKRKNKVMVVENNNEVNSRPSRSSDDSSDSNGAQINSLSKHDNVATKNFPRKMFNPPFLYAKRPGTSGIGGQLYETKLLSLLLLRALNHKDITKFDLGTNVEGIGAFDDILLKYEINGELKPKVLFIQAKHKDEPDKNKINFKDLFKDNGDFCLHKYFDSYLKIRSKFNANNNDDVFKYAFKDVDSDFIIYTSALENIGGRMLVIENDSETKGRLLQTSYTGKVFRLAYSDDEVEKLLETVLEIGIKLLGKTFMKFLFKDNYKNLLLDDMMKTYHVFLAQYVVEITSETEPKMQYLKGRFARTFLVSNNSNLFILREAIYNEFSLKYTGRSSDEIEKLVEEFTFNLPMNFGNINFIIGGSNRKIERKLIYICSKIKLLMDNAVPSGSYSVVKVDEDMVGPEMILQQADLEMYRLGGLVGNLFVFDNETYMLKFNESIGSLPPLVLRIFELIKKRYPEVTDFTKYRFDIIACRFPKLSIGRNMHKWFLVKEFLDNLTFYTNQGCENNVEFFLKTEITARYKLNTWKDKLNCLLKCESIFLKVHDTIQKWWKKPNNAPYLNESCKYYDEAKDKLFTNSLLNTLHYLYITKLNSYSIRFLEFVDQFVILNEENQSCLNIVTNNITLTSIKLIQYLQHHGYDSSCIFLNLDFIIHEKCFDEVLTELRELKFQSIFVTCENNMFYDKIPYLIDLLHGFVVVITQNNVRENVLLHLKSINFNELCEQRNGFIDLCEESQRKILNETSAIFQGCTVPLKSLIMNKFDLIDYTVLHTILNNGIIQIGREFISVNFDDFENDYLKRAINRFIILKTNSDDSIYIINETDAEQIIPEDTRDIIVISDKIQDFIKFTDTYADKNIHWFINCNGNVVWEKSRGSLHVLSKHVNKDLCESGKRLNPMTLLDIDEKVIILCAAPGMGKSTLMTYLSIQTKIKYPNYWILRINCLDFKNIFSDWQVHKTVIDIKEIMKFLYVVSLRSVNNVDECIVSVDSNGKVFIDNTIDQNIVGLANLELGIFNNLYNNGQIAIIFDGFDEISPDYLDQVIQCLEVLKKSKISRLWVTTRPYNIIDHLEQRLGTFAYILQKLSSSEQHNLLVKLLGKVVGEKPSDRLKLYVKKFMKPISVLLHDRQQEFTSIPLHIYMIAEVYQDFFKTYYDPYIPRLSDEYMKEIQNINSLTLYETFANKKFFDIRFGEKKPYIFDRDPDMKKMIETEHREFIKNHKKIAAHAIFDKTVQGLFSDQDKIDISDALERIRTGEERTGIIQRVVGEEPHFIHLTFAEYFATEYLCDKLKTGDCSEDLWIYLFDTIFVADKNVSVRLFFDLKLSVDKELLKINEKLKCNQKIFDALVKQSEATSLSIAAIEFSERNAMFLLQCIKDVLTKSNLGEFIRYITQRKKYSCTFCSIVDRRLKKVLEIVLEFVKRIDSTRLLELFTCGDVPLFNALGITTSYIGRFSEDMELFDFMLTSMENTDIALELFTMPSNMGLLKNTIVHVLVMNDSSIRLLLKHLLRFNKEQRMKIFNTFDADGKLAAHFAAQAGHFDFFAVLDFILDRDQFTKICLTYDNIGKTPIDYLLISIPDPQKFDLVKPLRDLYNERLIYSKRRVVPKILN